MVNYSHTFCEASLTKAFSVLSLLLRLRQICSHTALICEEDDVTIDDNIENTEESKRDEVIRAQRLLGRDFVHQLKEKLLTEMRARVEDEKQVPSCSPLPQRFGAEALCSQLMHRSRMRSVLSASTF